ncbi:MAG: PAS domain S-box protein [Syntrophobacterales bacterium]|nr:MAG: PAS domain S-box protein [Syntrophobacterales bacterium]
MTTRKSIELLKEDVDQGEQLKVRELEIQRLNEEIQRFRAFTESLIQSIGSGLILVDTKEQITFFNRAAEKILGYSKKEVVGKPLTILSLREKKQAMPAPFKDQDDMDSRREGIILRKDKVEIPIGFNTSDHLDSRGRRIGKIINFRDMTNVLKLQEEIIRMDRLISVGELSSGIAHEIRNPLAGIKTTAQALGEEMGQDDPRREYLNRITKEIDRLNDLLRTFFSFAKPQKLKLVVCNIRDIVNEIIPLLVKDIANKGINFTEEYAPDLPRVRVDFSQMHQVFLNLFLNAIQVMPRGGELKIRAEPIASAPLVNPGRDYVRISISDTGKGIAAHDVNKIFDPFFTTRAKGIGLGLSITYQIIKTHGGSIKVESKVDKGTTFTITLPK